MRLGRGNIKISRAGLIKLVIMKKLILKVRFAKARLAQISLGVNTSLNWIYVEFYIILYYVDFGAFVLLN